MLIKDEDDNIFSVPIISHHSPQASARLFWESVELLARAPLVVTAGSLEVTRDRIRVTRPEDEAEAAAPGGHRWAVRPVDVRVWLTKEVNTYLTPLIIFYTVHRHGDHPIGNRLCVLAFVTMRCDLSLSSSSSQTAR